MLFILKLLSASRPLNHKQFALSCHLAGNKSCIISAIFRISRVFNNAAAAKCQEKNRKNKTEPQSSAATSVSVCPNREPGNINSNYLQGYHLLPTGEEIAAYLLVNMIIIKTYSRFKKKKKCSYRDGKKREVGEKRLTASRGTVSFRKKGKHRETSCCNTSAELK